MGERNISPGVIKLRALSLRPLIKLGGVGDNLPLRINFDVNSIKWAGRRSFAIDAVAIEGAPQAEAASVTRAPELVFLNNPIRGASLMRTAREKHVQTIGVAYNTDAMRLKKSSVNSNCEIKRAANAKSAARLGNRLRQTTPQKEEHNTGKSNQGPDACRDDS
ncbi:MAG: hypothetical protein ND895_03875 [Pyrinomonadaceae bacterium]|nr:hypothetical protein [Pyrinomonadaceae bacterium]